MQRTFPFNVCDRRISRSVAGILLATLFLCSETAWPSRASAANRQYDSLWRQASSSDFLGWTLTGAAVHDATSGISVQLAPRSRQKLTCSSHDIDGGVAHFAPVAGLCAGTDPTPPGTYDREINYYNGGSFFYGTMLSPIHRLDRPIDHIIASWDAGTPRGTWLEVHVRMHLGQRWTRWYILSIWARAFDTVHRHSVEHQSDIDGGVDTDTAYLRSGKVASAYQLSVTLFTATPGVSPSLRLIAAIASHDAVSYPTIGPAPTIWGTELPVPQHSQMVTRYRTLQYGGGGEAWCSPASTSMVMGYWANLLHRPDLIRSVPEVARGTYDHTYDGTGNWPFNTAYAASFGFTAFVTRMYSLSQIERWIEAGVPIVMSIAFKQGELPGEPLKASAGHLIVVRGFTRRGDVITNDPGAATDAGVRIVYTRNALEHAWRTGSHGTVYVIYPSKLHPQPSTRWEAGDSERVLSVDEVEQVAASAAAAAPS